MKKQVQLFVVFLLILVVLIPLFYAAAYEDTKQRGYDCLLNHVEGNKCEGVTDLEDIIFSYLAVEHCYSQLEDEKEIDGDIAYWGSPGTDSLEMTAKAIIALMNAGEDVEAPSKYLSEKNTTPDGINWYIQVESYGLANCHVEYDGISRNFVLEEDRTITPTGDFGSCISTHGFDATDNHYWFKIGSGNDCQENKSVSSGMDKLLWCF